MSKVVGFVTYTKEPELTASDRLLQKAFKDNHISVQAVPWDADEIEWSSFSALIIRSCWNYHQVPTKFFTWLEQISQLDILVWNPVEIVRWNSHKAYLLELEQQGIPIIPTSILKPNTSTESIFEETGYAEIIIKPSIGASSEGVKHLHKGEKIQITTEMLIQPYMKEITQGELSVVFFGDDYSHTVIKYPGKEALYRPDQDIINQATEIVKKIPAKLLYARVDGIIVKGKFILMELELIEPHLFIDLYPQAADSFVRRFLSLQ